MDLTCINGVVGHKHHPILEIELLRLSTQKKRVLTGPNSSGKTTCLKTLCGLLPLISGDIRLNDQPLKGYSSDVQFIPENCPLFPRLTVAEHFNLKARWITHSWLSQDKLIQSLQLRPYLNHTPQKLSAGIKKLVGLVCGLYGSPKFIFVDEPTSDLDPHHRLCVLELFNELIQHDVGIVMSTHLEEDKKDFQEQLIIEKGKLTQRLNTAAPEVSTLCA